MPRSGLCGERDLLRLSSRHGGKPLAGGLPAWRLFCARKPLRHMQEMVDAEGSGNLKPIATMAPWEQFQAHPEVVESRLPPEQVLPCHATSSPPRHPVQTATLWSQVLRCGD